MPGASCVCDIFGILEITLDSEDWVDVQGSREQKWEALMRGCKSGTLQVQIRHN